MQILKSLFSKDEDRWSIKRLFEKSKEELSPSGRYRLVIRTYDQGAGFWNYSRGTVYRVSDGEEVGDIKRNYSQFHHSIVTKDGAEYLISGRSYMGQAIVNLETGEEFNDEIWKAEQKYCGFEFCWAQHWLSPDGNTLVVCGCIWGGPYEFHFFDFTDPSKGWPSLEQPINIDAGYEDNGDPGDPIFEEDGTISVGISTMYFKPWKKHRYEFTEADEEALTDEQDDDYGLWEDVDCKRIKLIRNGNRMELVKDG